LELYQRKVYKLYTVPAIVLTIILVFVPLIYGMYLSFTNYDLLKNTNDFVGIKNYIKVLSDLEFYKAIGRNIAYVILVVSFNFIIGFGMAYICSMYDFFGNKLLRFIIVLPMLLIPASAAVLWRFMYNSEVGFINSFLSLLSLPKVNWLVSSNLALLSVIITDIWAWTPWMFLILLSAIEGMDKDVLDAANVDGVNSFQRIKNVILPMIWPIILIAVSMKSIDTFRTFDYVWIMTTGGPGSASDITSTFIYKRAFKHLQYGYASAMSFIVLVVVAILAIFIVRKLIARGDRLNEE